MVRPDYPFEDANLERLEDLMHQISNPLPNIVKRRVAAVIRHPRIESGVAQHATYRAGHRRIRFYRTEPV